MAIKKKQLEKKITIGFESQSSIGVKDAIAPAKLVVLQTIFDTYVKVMAKKAKKNSQPYG